MEVLLIGGAGGGPSSVDRFAPTILVGNELAGDPATSQAAPFAYIPDPGDGTGIAAALAAVPIDGAWIHVRRGIYTLDPGILPLTVPSNCRVTGDGPGATVLIGNGSNRRVFNVVGNDVELARLGVLLPTAEPNATGTVAIDAVQQRAFLDRIHVTGPGIAAGVNESLLSVIRIGGDAVVQQCRVSLMPTGGTGLACVRIPGFGPNSRVMDNFLQGGDYQIFADGASGAATGLHILHNYCLANEDVFSCINLASGGSSQFVRGNRCVSGENGIRFSANGGHVAENQCYNQTASPIVLAGSSIVCIGNTISTGAVIDNFGLGNVVAHNTQF